MANVTIMEHPLIQHKIGLIRRKDTGTKDFRQTISEIAMLICYEATRELKLDEVEIETPICKTMVKELRGKKMAIVPILRAGLGMPELAISGFIGIRRPSSRWNITASCLRTVRSGRCSWWILCWPRGAHRWQPYGC